VDEDDGATTTSLLDEDDGATTTSLLDEDDGATTTSLLGSSPLEQDRVNVMANARNAVGVILEMVFLIVGSPMLRG
jgi:hypothetical protein